MIISLRLYEIQLKIIKKLVEEKIFFSISGFLRTAILIALLDNDFKKIDNFNIDNLKINKRSTSFRCPENLMSSYDNYEIRTIFIRKAVFNLITEFEEKIF